MGSGPLPGSGRHSRLIGIIPLAALLLCACAPEEGTRPTSGQADLPASEPGEEGAEGRVRFVDVAAETGLDFTHVSGSPEQRWIIEAMAGGAAFLDYDGDQYLDLFLINSTRVDGAPEDAHNRLYRNAAGALGEERRVFRDVTEQAGLRRSGWGMGCAVGDYDNDGDVDLYLTYWGPNLLYRNEGDGRFSDVTAAARVGDERWGSSAAFGDVDGDGRLDLYACNYVVLDLENPPNDGEMCAGYQGLEGFCGPMGMERQADVLYRNEGDGRFADVSGVTGVGQYRYAGLGILFGDHDNDGDQDIFVANDGGRNLLFRNDGNWRLSEIATSAGVAYNEEGRVQSGMGIAAGDYNNDGNLDILVTNHSDDVNTLYRNQGDGSFVDVTAGARLGGEVRPYLCWTPALFDADNDGWEDIFVAAGHIFPALDSRPTGMPYAQRNLFYWNEGGTFRLAVDEVGPGLTARKVSRGAAFGDYDNDGDVDLLVMNLNDRPTLLRNEGGNHNNWLGLDLEGVSSNADGIGAQVRLFAPGQTLMREARRGYGYQTQSDGRVIFGLGEDEQVDRVEIRWPSGRVQVLERPEPRQYLVIREGAEDPITGYGKREPPGRQPAGSGQPGRRKPASGSEPRGQVPQYAIDPNWTAEQLYETGVELYGHKRYEEARQLLSAAIQRRPDYYQACYALGVTLYSGLGRNEEAARVLEEAVARDSSRAQIFHLLGAVYLSLDQPEQAINALRRATLLDPLAWKTHNRIGLAHLRRGDLEAAIAAFQDALRAGPFAATPHLRLAEIYSRQGRAEEAQRERSEYERLKGAHEELATALDQIKETPDNSEAHYRLGHVYLQQARYANAQASFERAVALDPEYGQARYGLGAAYHHQGRLADAIQAYARAHQIDPTLVMALNDMGQALHQMGRPREAIQIFRKAARLRPDLAMVHSNLGDVLAAQRRRPEAIAAFAAALALDSTLVQTRNALARLYGLEGNLEAAIREWRRVLRQAPDHPTARAHLTEARTRLAAP